MKINLRSILIQILRYKSFVNRILPLRNFRKNLQKTDGLVSTSIPELRISRGRWRFTNALYKFFTRADLFHPVKGKFSSAWNRSTVNSSKILFARSKEKCRLEARVVTDLHTIYRRQPAATMALTHRFSVRNLLTVRRRRR